MFLLALIATLAVVAPNGTLSAVGPTMAHELGTGAQPSWSPDGLRLAFVRDGDVWTIDATGSNATRLTADGVNSLPVWSPDGTRLAWLKDSTLVSGGADGVGLATLAGGLSAAPAWSPDGTKLAFERRAGADAALMIVPAAGGAVTRLGFGASTVAPAWLGSTIAYVDDHRLFLWPGHRAQGHRVERAEPLPFLDRRLRAGRHVRRHGHEGASTRQRRGATVLTRRLAHRVHPGRRAVADERRRHVPAQGRRVRATGLGAGRGRPSALLNPNRSLKEG